VIEIVTVALVVLEIRIRGRTAAAHLVYHGDGHVDVALCLEDGLHEPRSVVRAASRCAAHEELDGTLRFPALGR
jgi:hypothetical protein